MDKHIRDVIGVKLEPTAGVEPEPGRVDQMLTACGYNETMMQPLRFAVEDMPDSGSTLFTGAIVSFDPAATTGYAVVTVDSGVIVSAQRRAGDTLFDAEALDAFEAAGVEIFEDEHGIRLDIPRTGISIPGKAIAQLLSKPLTSAEFAFLEKHPAAPPVQDYLRHDPTKRHNRRRKPR